ncbi:MAG: site-specific DNA-methyltransferase [Thermodesulfovibrionales bacterium]|nr:site-specific DNA-methyltransferase [Thermodesulfovibrionales bacterium]
MSKKYYDSSWNFIGANTKKFTHCFHNYPAMMIPQVAQRLILTFCNNAKLLFDPYCGTGTSLLEANLNNTNAIGTDLNPLARLISKAKTTKLDLQVLDLYLKEFTDYMFSIMFEVKKINIVVPNIKNIDYWFSSSVQEKLALIKKFIDNITDTSVADFFRVAFSETVRESSWTRNGEFKMYRMTEEQIKRFKPDVFALMQNKLARNKKGMKDFIEMKSLATSKIFDFNTVDKIEHIENESVDIIITSPPYGDSRTTVAYGQFSRLANEWLDIENASLLDNKLMGGKIKQAKRKFDIDLLNLTIEQIADKDEKRASEVATFYHDYNKSINNVAKTLKKGGFACYVVGNRKVKGVTLPTDEITKCFFEFNGFEHIQTIIRDIPNKRMPLKNSPSNITGAIDTTMNHEYIVVMKKM